jgi:hypothetical protein
MAILKPFARKKFPGTSKSVNLTSWDSEPWVVPLLSVVR